MHPAPRLAARWRAGSATQLSLAASRVVQYTQALPRLGYGDDARFYPGALWLVAGANAPVLTADVATLGAERWLGRGWLAASNAYVRRTHGIASPDPTPGLPSSRPLFVRADGLARGLELSARRLAGRTTATVAYGFGVSTLEAAGLRYPSPEDRTHTLDFTVSRQLSRSWRLGGAFSAASGAPFTRATDVAPSPPTSSPTDYGRELGPPNAERRPPLLGLDVAAEWARRFGGWDLGAFAQLHSPLATQSTGSYHGSGWCAVAPDGQRDCHENYKGGREDTIPLIPALGLRIAF